MRALTLAVGRRVQEVMLTIAALLGVLCLVGLVLLPVVGIAALVFSIIAALKANDGIMYRYPFTLRLLK